MNTQNGLSLSVHLYLDDNRGQYIPRDFARTTKRDCILGVDHKDLDYLARGPGGCLDEDSSLADGESVRGEFYWDTWETVCDNALLIDPITNNRFRLYQDGSLFLVPEDWQWNEDTQSFERPEDDTLHYYKLPAYWASYLVNADASGLSDEEKKQCDDFILREELSGWSCTDVSQSQWFSHSNDAGTLAGDVARFTFIKF